MAKNRESSVRWTAIGITQLGYAINLILTFSTAALGFALALLRDNDFVLGSGARLPFDISLVALLASIGLGMWCVINRLKDFRESRSIATEREKLEDQTKSREEMGAALRKKRTENRGRGEFTWRLFHWQTGTFATGILTLALAFVLSNSAKLGL